MTDFIFLGSKITADGDCSHEIKRLLVVKNLPANAGRRLRDSGFISGLGRSPGEGHGNPTPVFLPGESQGWGSLVGHRLWGRTESDMTEAT